jgi:hypothetical protein
MTFSFYTGQAESLVYKRGERRSAGFTPARSLLALLSAPLRGASPIDFPGEREHGRTIAIPFGASG